MKKRLSQTKSLLKMRLELSKFPQEKSARLKYLVENKKSLITQMKSLPVTSSGFSANVYNSIDNKEGSAFKAVGSPGVNEDGSIRVKVVANMSMWCDSYMDVMGAGCWTKSIRENGPSGKNTIVHIHDHVHRTDALVGDVKAIYAEKLNLYDLGYGNENIKESEALIFETDILKDDNPKVYNNYKRGRIKQHSIGFHYVKLDLAVDEEVYELEHSLWKQHIDKIINKEFVKEIGYFWYVSEIRLLENSAVLFGANEITPDLSGRSTEPLVNTLVNEPSEKDTQRINYDYLKNNFKL